MGVAPDFYFIPVGFPQKSHATSSHKFNSMLKSFILYVYNSQFETLKLHSTLSRFLIIKVVIYPIQFIIISPITLPIIKINPVKFVIILTFGGLPNPFSRFTSFLRLEMVRVRRTLIFVKQL